MVINWQVMPGKTTFLDGERGSYADDGIGQC